MGKQRCIWKLSGESRLTEDAGGLPGSEFLDQQDIGVIKSRRGDRRRIGGPVMQVDRQHPDREGLAAWM